MRPATKLPLWFKPNAGIPELVDGKTVFRETPEEMAAYLPELIAAGANVIGGCCGTAPEHIRLFAAEMPKLLAQQEDR
jgi:5-methyltetrahydrofolate--homocysteine methyltransferase